MISSLLLYFLLGSAQSCNCDQQPVLRFIRRERIVLTVCEVVVVVVVVVIIIIVVATKVQAFPWPWLHAGAAVYHLLPSVFMVY